MLLSKVASRFCEAAIKTEAAACLPQAVCAGPLPLYIVRVNRRQLLEVVHDGCDAMTPSQGAELAVALLCLAAFIAYHVWIFCCDTHIKGYIKVMLAARNARRVWARSIAADDKETVTGWANLLQLMMVYSYSPPFPCSDAAGASSWCLESTQESRPCATASWQSPCSQLPAATLGQEPFQRFS